MDLPLDASQIRIDVEEHPGYLRFRMIGTYDFEDFRLANRAMREACAERGAAKALIDLVSVRGEVPQFDRYNLGIEFAAVWGHSPKVAILAPVSQVNSFFENTAVNRQARVKVFSDERAALMWLIQS